MLTDDDYDSIMGKILIPEEPDPRISAHISPGTVICTTLNEGHSDGEEKKKEEEPGIFLSNYEK